MRLMQALVDRGVIASPAASALLRDAVSDLETCPEIGARVDDAIRTFAGT